MSNTYAIWQYNGSNNLGKGRYVTGRPITDDELDKIVNHEVLKKFKPFVAGNYLMIKVNPRWYELGGALPVLDRCHIHLLDILGIEAEPEDLPPFVMPPAPPKVIYSDAPAAFEFEFSWDNPESLIQYRFEFLDKRQKLRKWMMSPPDGYYDFIGRMEGYGVHDGYGGDSEDGMDVVVGFHSYEIDPSKYMEVLEKWHNYFSKKGYTLGPIYKVAV